jgi:hypothetical protein
MLIMTLSYTQKSNDKSLISTYVSMTLPLAFIHRLNGNIPQFNLLDQWTQFLITDSLIPANQISTDDFAGSLANQTNLAIKGIVGIKAMSSIASLVGDSARSSNYSVSSLTPPNSCCSHALYRTLRLRTSNNGRNWQHRRLGST